MIGFANDWPLPGQNYENTRAASRSEINAANVGSLTPIWSASVELGLTTVPLIAGDTVFVQDRAGNVYALDFDTGAVRWRYELSGFNPGPNGVAFGYGKVFGVSTDDVFALDAQTGNELWSTRLTRTETDGIDMQPIVVGDKILISTVPISVRGQYAGGDRGIMYALDAASGNVLWAWDTVDSEDLWGNAEVNSGGGVWYPPAIDQESGTIHVGTANPAPFPGTAEYPNGSSRPGPNLYTNAAVALDAATGEMRWYHQVHPHDIFDRDQVHTMLVDVPDGLTTVISAGKGGRVLGLDPATGDVRWETAVGLHRNDELTELSGPTEVLPGTYGGVLTPPASADGVIFAPVVNAPQVLLPSEPDYFGADLGVMDGELVAIDAATGEVLWIASVDGDPLGGATVINDLVLTATLQGEVMAFQREGGELAWRVRAAGGIIGSMAVSGSTIIVPVGNADPPQVVAYRLTD